ncbi:ROK family protein [Streptomyces sp. NPDC007818]|uniref:ROK family protein n=1 Tax=Streptomyces sp. NPDC007818 TaxID=3364780 RepID=UPI0036C88CA5
MTAAHVIAVDVGGTTVKGALVTSDHRIVAETRRPTPRHQGPDEIIRVIVETVDELRNHGLVVTRAGIVVPGIVDDDRGYVVLSTNLGLREVPLAARLRQLVGLPVTVGHDVRAGAVAEASLGAAAGRRHALFMAIGTGIAGAFITDGHLLCSDGWAGEIGHLTIDPRGPDCPCGSHGCLETLASARAIADAFTRHTGIRVDGAADVAQRVLDGDPMARVVWDGAVGALAEAAALLTTALGPEIIVIGGGLGDSGELLLGPLRDRLADLLTFQRVPTVVRASLGSRAGCVGAGRLAWRDAAPER